MTYSALGFGLANSFRDLNSRTYEALSSAAIAAARRNDAMLLYVPDTRANVFTNADTSYAQATLGSTIARWLDSQYGTASIGPELVTNGNFNTGINGWTQTRGVVTWSSGAIRVARASSYSGRATSPITCEVGATYRIMVDRSTSGGVATAGVTVTISPTSTVGNVLSDSGGSAAWSTMDRTFIATQTTHWVMLETGSGTDGQYAEYDNVSVKKISEAPASRGPELLTNADFSAWSSDNPVGWTLAFTETAQTYVTQASPGARLVTTDGTYNEVSQNVTTTGKVYEVLINVTAVTGTLVVLNAGNSPLTITAPGIYRALFTSVGAVVGIKRGVGGVACDATVAWMSCKEVLGYHARQPTASNKPTLTRIPRKTASDIVINGGFDSASNWTTSLTTISGGVLSLNSQFASAQQDITGLEVGATYEVSYDVISATGTSPIALSGTGFSGSTQVMPAVVGSRNYFLTVCTNAGAPLLVIAPNASTTITIDNISLRKVTEWSYAVTLDGVDDWMDLMLRDHFASGAYTFIASWWGPVTGNSSFIVAQSSTGNTNPLVSPLFVPSASVDAGIFERGDTGTTGLSGSTYVTGALTKTSIVELTQIATPVGNFKGYQNGVLDRNTNYTRVSESVTTNKLTLGAAQRISVSGYGKGTFALICLAPSTMPDADRRAIARFAAFLNGVSYA